MKPIPEFFADAACIGADPDLFFPDKGGSVEPAKAICQACPVREGCRAYGFDEGHGVWGGLSERDRRRMRRQAKAAVPVRQLPRTSPPSPTAPPSHGPEGDKLVAMVVEVVERIAAKVGAS